MLFEYINVGTRESENLIAKCEGHVARIGRITNTYEV